MIIITNCTRGKDKTFFFFFFCFKQIRQWVLRHFVWVFLDWPLLLLCFSWRFLVKNWFHSWWRINSRCLLYQLTSKRISGDTCHMHRRVCAHPFHPQFVTRCQSQSTETKPRWRQVFLWLSLWPLLLITCRWVWEKRRNDLNFSRNTTMTYFYNSSQVASCEEYFIDLWRIDKK